MNEEMNSKERQNQLKMLKRCLAYNKIERERIENERRNLDIQLKQIAENVNAISHEICRLNGEHSFSENDWFDYPDNDLEVATKKIRICRVCGLVEEKALSQEYETEKTLELANN